MPSYGGLAQALFSKIRVIDDLFVDGAIGASGDRVADIFATNIDVTNLTVGSFTPGTSITVGSITINGVTDEITTTAGQLKIGKTIDMQTNSIENLTNIGTIGTPIGTVYGTSLVASSQVFFNSVAGPRIFAQTGVPITPDANGSVCLRTDGAGGTTLYVREGGAWVAK